MLCKLCAANIAYMYLRVSKQKRADGSQIAHLQFAESTWDPAKKRSQVRILYNFGRAEDPAVIERLRRLATSILKRVAELACGDTWRNIRDDLKQIKLAQLLSPNGTVWQVTEPGSSAATRLKSLQINKPPPILRVD